jgi:hypothetical protein
VSAVATAKLQKNTETLASNNFLQDNMCATHRDAKQTIKSQKCDFGRTATQNEKNHNIKNVT